MVYVVASLVLAVVRLCHRLVRGLEDMRRQADLTAGLASASRRAAGSAVPDCVVWKQRAGACMAPVLRSGLEGEKWQCLLYKR